VTTRIAVFASGSGTNLQALLDSEALSREAAVGLVISDRADAGALQRARAADIPAVHVAVRQRPGADVARDTLAALQAHAIDFVALAGYLRLVPAAVTAAFGGRITNIHPALLPAFGGAGMYGRKVHEAVIAAGSRVSGATVHWVDERYDEGGIIAQWPVPVLPGDDPSSLAARVLRVEHVLYPTVLAALVRRRRMGSAAATAPAATVHADATFRLTQSATALDSDIIGLTGL
jgi:phosphoribosylglycinamide formyltransferase 1